MAAGTFLLPAIFSWGQAGREPAEAERQGRQAEGYVDAEGGVRLYYRVLGSAGDTVVVVHGGPGAGMGAILPHVAPLAEHSFGAILAAEYAVEYPDRVERMVFLKATGPKRAAAAAIYTSPYEQADSATVDSLRTVLGQLLQGTGDDPVALCREYERLGLVIARQIGRAVNWRGTTCDAPPEAVRYYYRYTAQLGPKSFGDWDFTGGLEEIEAPVLVVQGARDTLGLPVQRAWASAFPLGRLLLVPATDTPIADRPQVVFDAIEEFFAGEWPAGSTPVP
jgi:pimeloyl-ACP methyl ester carboxylesterase